MSKTKAKQFRKERADDLRRLARVLEKYDLCTSSGPIMQAASQCGMVGPTGPLGWEYQVDGLRLSVPEPLIGELGVTEPPGLTALEIELNVDLAGSCLVPDEGADPFFRLNVELLLRGSVEDAHQFHHAAWHLDRQIDGQTNGCSLVHPLYHVQYGGQGLPTTTLPPSRLLLESPRLPHAPMDAVLAVDFVLANYFADIWTNLRVEEGPYHDILMQSQDVCWKFFASRLQDPFPLSENAVRMQELWPQFVARRPMM